MSDSVRQLWLAIPEAYVDNMDQVARQWGSTLRSAIGRTAVIAATWSALTAGSGDDRLIGVATAGVALATSYVLLPRHRFELTALPRLVAFFLVESMRSGLQVALLALTPRRRPAPTTLELEIGLGDLGSRTALAVLLSVMPGTLAVAVDGSRLTLHVLDARRPAEPLVRRAEALLLRLVGDSRP